MSKFPEPITFLEQADHTLNTEFTYYCALLQELIPVQNSVKNQQLANRWLTKLTEPTLNVKSLREKRNKLLMMLSISLLTDNLRRPFDLMPSNALPQIPLLRPLKFQVPKWQTHATEWPEHNRMLLELAKKLKTPTQQKCQTHENQCTGTKDPRGTFLDRQFEFFLHLSRTYLGTITTYPELRIANHWLQALCQIDRDSCIRTKGIRNDYILALTAYLLQHQLLGPFRVLPSYPLEPLMDAARKAAGGKLLREPREIEDLSGAGTGHFVSSFPVPEEGAFAVISLSSDLLKLGTLESN
ncbi:uncharacterized protein LOC129754397 [Uranotaenia lowii]|uniref:uncharacterized protein LOC129754397 n=1 Tax=Uranotaenia lowii TaxID=190385 RepID=UPI00247832EF|nr:uncharacterized protein LOC129754397 [Uranotaenia lowii]